MKLWQSHRASTIATILLLIGTVAFAELLGAANEKLRCKHGYSFPDLQNAALSLHPVAKAETILKKWNEERANDAIRQTMKADLAFPLFYAPLFALLAWWAHLRRTKPWVIRLGRWAAVGALIAGLADWGENATMLTMVDQPETAVRVLVMLGFTWIKNAGLMLATTYVLLSHLDS